MSEGAIALIALSLIWFQDFIRVSNDEKINYILEFGAGNAQLARDLILYLEKKKCQS